MLVREVMRASVVTVVEDASVRDAARVLVDHDVAAAPVVDGAGRLVGVVGEIDLIRRDVLPDQRAHALRVRVSAGPAGGPPPRTVRDVMTHDVVTVPPTADVADVVAVMVDHHLRSLPVVDGERLAGVVSRRDVVRVLIRDDELLRAEVARRLAGVMPGGPWLVGVADGVARLACAGPVDARLPAWEALAGNVAATVPGIVGVALAGRALFPESGRRDGTLGPCLPLPAVSE